MHYSRTEMAEIRRLRRHLALACALLVVILTGSFLSGFANAFIEAGPGGQNPSDAGMRAGEVLAGPTSGR